MHTREVYPAAFASRALSAQTSLPRASPASGPSLTAVTSGPRKEIGDSQSSASSSCLCTRPLRPGLPTSTPSLLLHPLGQSKPHDQLRFKGRGTRPMGDAAELEAKGIGLRKGEEMGPFLLSTERVTKHFILSIKT